MGTDRRRGIFALLPNGGQNYPTELTQNLAIRNDLAIPTESQAPIPIHVNAWKWRERVGRRRRSEAGKQKEWQWQYFTIKPISVSPRWSFVRAGPWPFELPGAEGGGGGARGGRRQDSEGRCWKEGGTRTTKRARAREHCH